MTPIIDIADQPTKADRTARLAGLTAFNEDAAGSAMRPRAVWLRDDDGGLGLIGRPVGRWRSFAYFWLPEARRRRGPGSIPIGSAERKTLVRGRVGVWPDTFGFQARQG